MQNTKNQKKFWKSLLIILIFSFLSCEKTSQIQKDYPEHFTLKVKNTIDLRLEDAPVILPIDKIQEKHPEFNPNAFVILDKKNEIPSQADNLERDEKPDKIVFVTDFEPKQENKLTIHYASSGIKTRVYPKRTQAEVSHKVGGKFKGKKYIEGKFQNVQFVRVPREQTDHSTFFRYEGPGWESDKVGYRFYLDWRNAIDIFGKKIPDMVLQNVGLDNFDSYHEMADWGMDILKVGESLGIGSIGMWYKNKANRVAKTDSITCEIVSNGPVRSIIRTRYSGWKIGHKKFDLTSNLSITAGSRLTKNCLLITGQPDNLCTGLAKHEECQVIKTSSESKEEWQYLGLWGKHSLAGDNLGTAILYRKQDLIEITDDDLNHVVILKPDSGKLSYYFLAAWEQEPGGIKTQEEFENYLKQTVLELSNPIEVVFDEN